MDVIDASELGRWFEQEANALVLYARQWLDPSTAEDAVQEVFITLTLQSPPPNRVKAWLYRAVRNQAFKLLRSRTRRAAREAWAASEAPGWFEPRADDAIDARRAEEALRALSAEEREIVTLRIWGGLTLQDIAVVVQNSVTTVFRRYQSGLQQLRKHLETPCPTPR